MPRGFWRTADEDPRRIAIVHGAGTEHPYGELLATSRALAAGLAASGARRGDVVAAVLGNDPRFLATLLAAFETGLYFTPVNVHLAPPEIAYVLEDCAPVAVVDDPTFDTLLVRDAGTPPERSPG